MTDINIQPLDFIRNLLDTDDSDPVREMLAPAARSRLKQGPGLK